MTNEQMRREFEDWARRCCDATDSDLKRDKHGYFWIEWQRAFAAWQTATLKERERCALVCVREKDISIASAKWAGVTVDQRHFDICESAIRALPLPPKSTK